MTPTGYKVYSGDEVEEAFKVSTHTDYPFLEFQDEQEQRVYESGLVAKNLTSEPDVDHNPYNIVVVGDLQVDGPIEWSCYNGSYVLVTGDVRCENLLLDGCPNIVVLGNLIVKNGIMGSNGEDGGLLRVRGKSFAKIIVNTLYFNMEFAHRPDAIICSDGERINCSVDFDDDQFDEVFLPEFFDDGCLEEGEVRSAIEQGHNVLRSASALRHARDKRKSELSSNSETTQHPEAGSNSKSSQQAADPDDPNYLFVQQKIKEASEKASTDPRAAVAFFEEALDRCTPNAHYPEKDELYGLYRLVVTLEELSQNSKDEEYKDVCSKIERYARAALERIPHPENIWIFTPEAAFQFEVTARCGNALAWMLYQRGEYEQGLPIIERALAAEGEHDYAIDTHVRLLLGLERDHQAYLIVDRLLAKNPTFGDFQDIKASDSFVAWQKENRG